jgi:uncharacterized protein
VKESRYNVWVERDDALYVYNGVSGALLQVPKDEYEGIQAFITGATEPVCTARIIELLVRGSMLIPSELDELELLAGRYRLSRHNTRHFALTIVTSLGCNFDCPYCYEDKHPSVMNKEVRKTVLELLDEKLPELFQFNVTWFGGEPLIGKRSLFALADEFIARCDKAGVVYESDIVTNGSLLDKETCNALQVRRVGSVQVTIDGPPEIHDRMRPLANGAGSFWRVVENLNHAVDYFPVTIRVNVDAQNISHVEELLVILAREGLAGRVGVYPGQIVGVNDGAPAPSASYRAPCLTNRQFAQAELEFAALARRHGFARPSLPAPAGAPCTAVRANELVVGSSGELYKCWNSVGNRREVIGHIRDWKVANGRLAKWLRYDPFADPECRTCIALPGCMGGCAHHALDAAQYENRCGTFRHTYREKVDAFVEAVEADGTNAALHAAPALARRMETR